MTWPPFTSVTSYETQGISAQFVGRHICAKIFEKFMHGLPRSACLTENMSVCLTENMSVCLTENMSVCLTENMSVCLSNSWEYGRNPGCLGAVLRKNQSHKQWHKDYDCCRAQRGSTLFLTRGDFSRVHSTQSFARFVYSRDLDLVSVRCPYVLKTSVKQSRTLNDGSLALGTRMDWSHPALPSLGRRAWAVTSQLTDVIPKPVYRFVFRWWKLQNG
jgi:hypothetical protein